ncbi:hypothetical protein MNBD_NITROSPINAE04-2142 [hydrothermal vent metagenome]|uniref:Uncharacterized protein n=1 Tax=hydrothermal vent metagenome TaxID=652676 RepID=A0A3B1CZ64_9ZZZZ
MSEQKYKFQQANFSKIVSYPIEKRKSLVNTGMFADIDAYGKTGKLADLLPSALKATALKEVVKAIRNAKENGKPVMVGMGAHVIKVGLSPVIIDMMGRGYIDAVAMNGAGAVHDLEIAFNGATSEDVASEIKEGRFGMVEETSAHYNSALGKFATGATGIGEALGRYIAEEKMPNAAVSIMAQGWELKKPVTIHSAIGTDIVHIHPDIDGEVTGRATLNDFKLFTGIVSEMGNGGVYLNIGSAVLLPEIFIKALSAARNLGADVTNFTTVNLDMIQHYRPAVNVVNRPIQGAGKGISITGHHEILIPLIYHLLLNEGEKMQ